MAETRDKSQWVQRKGESRQKAINITGSIIVAISVLAIGAVVKMIFDLKATVNKADINTKTIAKTSRVLHNRATVNHEKLEIVSELSVRADVRSRINERRIEILEIRRK